MPKKIELSLFIEVTLPFPLNSSLPTSLHLSVPSPLTNKLAYTISFIIYLSQLFSLDFCHSRHEYLPLLLFTFSTVPN